jgi:hypothetical protein
MKYHQVISTEEKSWKTKAIKLIETATDFAVTGIATKEDYDFCIALAQEFDYRNPFEDKAAIEMFPNKIPHTLGFKHKSKFRFPQKSGN